MSGRRCTCSHFTVQYKIKMRVFQFKILHNILYTNDKLFKMRQVETRIYVRFVRPLLKLLYISFVIVKTLKT